VTKPSKPSYRSVNHLIKKRLSKPRKQKNDLTELSRAEKSPRSITPVKEKRCGRRKDHADGRGHDYVNRDDATTSPPVSIEALMTPSLSMPKKTSRRVHRRKESVFTRRYGMKTVNVLAETW
jgi:hypothetical protein